MVFTDPILICPLFKNIEYLKTRLSGFEIIETVYKSIRRFSFFIHFLLYRGTKNDDRIGFVDIQRL